MKRRLAIVAILILAILSIPNAVAFATEPSPYYAYHVYVDASANAQKADGTKDHPFTTIKAAKEYVKTLDKNNGDIMVEIADGIYYIDETLEFAKEDSGNENCTIHYQAAKDARPLLCGGEKLEGKWQDEGDGIYSIAYDRDVKLRSMYVNGKRCYMTSNKISGSGGKGSYSVTKNQASWAWDNVSVYNGVGLVTAGLDENTINQDDIELMTQTTWNTTIVCVDRITKSGNKVTADLQMPYGAIAQKLTSSNAFKFTGDITVSNVYEWLDDEGEFYFNKTQKRLYYMKRADEDLDTANVIIPKVETIIKIQGENKENHVSHLLFGGLKFAYTDWNLFNVGDSYGRATNQGAASLVAVMAEDSNGKNFHNSIYRGYDFGPAAIMVSSADSITFANDVVCHTGNDGISIINDVQDVHIADNIIYDIAGAATIVGHPQHMYIGDKNSDKGLYSDKELYNASQEALCERITISDSYFSDLGVLFAGNPGVMIYAGKKITFEGNTLKNAPYSGISIGWGWWNLNGDPDSVVPGEPMECMREIVVQENAFYNCLTTLSDGGAIYTLGDMPQSVISKNYIKDVAVGVPVTSENVDKIRGIHLDEGSAHIFGEKNVIDIDSRFACIDNGDWGRQHDNRWDDNYSRTDRYSTWGWSEGTEVTNKHVEEGTWSMSAQAFIDRAGLSSVAMQRVDEELQRDGSEFNIAQKSNKTTIIIIVASVAGALLIAGAITAAVIITKKKKNKTVQESI